MGFATAHLEVIREPGKPVSQAGALLAGQDEMGERGSLWSLSVSPFTRLSTLLSLFHSFSLPHTHIIVTELKTCSSQTPMGLSWRLQVNELNQARGKKEKVLSLFPFAYMSICPIYLFISPSDSRLPGESERLGMCLWCVCRFVYVFKVGRFCLTRTMEDRDLGEDKWLPL